MVYTEGGQIIYHIYNKEHRSIESAILFKENGISDMVKVCAASEVKSGRSRASCMQ